MNRFLSCDQGFLEIHNRTIDFVANAMYAVLVTTSHTPNRANDNQYSNVEGSAAVGADIISVAGKSINLVNTKIRYSCNPISFGSNVSLSGRYIYICVGNHAAPNVGDRIIGYISLSDSGNVSSVNSVFSYTPATEGLLELTRTAAPV